MAESTAQFIQECIAGKRQAQNLLYTQFAPKMFGVCLRYAKNRQEAEEILQEGFVQVFRSMHSFKFAGSFEGWVRKIMVFCAIQHYRKIPKMYSVTDVESLGCAEPDTENILAGLYQKELLGMVQALPPVYRIVFNLYVFEGLKHREIANQLGISEGTSKSNLYDAKRLLQKAVHNSLQVAKHY